MQVSKYAEDHEKAERIVSTAIELSGVRPDAESRRRGIVAVRASVCYAIRKATDLSLSEIADYVGYKDHSTIKHYLDNEVYDLEFVDRILFRVNQPEIPRLSVVNP